MKKKIHPKYNSGVEVKCACGSTFKVGSTAEKIDIEICDKCHPFYTGKEKLVDSTGRVDRFEKRMKKSSAMQVKKTNKKKVPKKEKAIDTPEKSKKEAGQK